MKARELAMCVGLVLILAACAGSSKEETAPPAGGSGDTKEAPRQLTPEEKRAEAIRKLDARQHKSCEGVCARISDCAIEDARKNNPELLKKPPGAQKLWELRYKTCLKDCSEPKLSLRQVKVYEACSKIERNCPEFFTCMDAAAPKKK